MKLTAPETPPAIAAVFPFFSSTTISTCFTALGTFIRLKCPSCAFLRIWINVEGFEGSARFPSSSRAANFLWNKVKLMVVRPDSFYFWNQCRKESDPTYSDAEIERWISRLTSNRSKMTSFKFRVVLCRIRLFPTVISKLKWHGSELLLASKMQNMA